MVRTYLQLTRAHTAPLETVPAILGALLATGGQITFAVVGWAIFGLLYHLAGYGMNSVVDWQKGYDKLDRKKSHHPLNRGALTLNRAYLFVGGLFVLLLALGVGLAWGEYLALAIMALGAIMGVTYNLAGKITTLKFIPISIAHTTVFIIPYVALGGDIFRYDFRLVTLYIFLWVVFQISVSGEIKDVQQRDESNFLRDTLGIRMEKRLNHLPDEDYIFFSSRAVNYSLALKFSTLMIGAIIYLFISGDIIRFTEENILWLAVWGLMMIPTAAFTVMLVRSGIYYRSWRINMMARIELLTMFILIASLTPAIGLGAVVTLIVVSLVWVLALNRIEWGTWLAPDV